LITSSGAFGLTKVGAGKAVLTANNTYSGTTTVSQGTLLVNGTHSGVGAFTVNSGATLGGTGSLGGAAVNVDAGGNLAPGASIESLDVGNTTINGKLIVEYQGSSIDLLNVGGNLNIANATVDFDSLGALSAGAHVFATYTSRTGSFASVLDLPGGFTIDYNYLNANQIALVPGSSPGDYNGDNKVNAADYVTWRKNPSGPGNGGDPGGYITWRENFGPAAGSSSGLSDLEPGAVPEPTSFVILLTSIAAGLVLRRPREM
jgi:autotransporter-associated beta strand protein